MMRSRKSISLSLSLGAGFGLNRCAAGWVRPRSEVASTSGSIPGCLLTAMLLSLGTSPVGQVFSLFTFCVQWHEGGAVSKPVMSLVSDFLALALHCALAARI